MDPLDDDRTTPARQGDDALLLTRSEEQLQVALARRPYERVVVRKRVVTETVTQEVQVEVRREVLEVERTAIDDPSGAVDVAGAGAAASEAGVLEVVLHEERPVVGVRAVPVERVRVVTETVRGERVVEADLRSERIDLDAEQAPTGSAAGRTAG